jgi:trigger factor
MSLESKIKFQVTEQEIQSEVQKQLRMMPGQEKMVMDFLSKKPFGCG